MNDYDTKLNIMVILGTRPEIVKMAPVVRAILEAKQNLQLVHTGQHYDYEMSQAFIENLKLPKPSVNLEIGSSSHAQQLSMMIKELEIIIDQLKPDFVLAQGDTNTVLASSLVCSKMDVPFGHVEAGIRSFDMTMPEEINRKLAGAVSNASFAPSERAVYNLLAEGIEPSRIFLTGNTVVDATYQHLELARKTENKIIDSIYDFIGGEKYILCTIHRPSNVDGITPLNEILKAFSLLDKQGIKIIFPIHPRTRNNIKKFGLLNEFESLVNLSIVKPLEYLSFLRIMSDCSLLLTDSGGIQEEAVTLKKRCITLRENTERPETLEVGLNELSSTEANKIFNKTMIALQKSENEELLSNFENPYGDGTAAKKIIDIVIKKHKELAFTPPSFITKGAPKYHITKLDSKKSKKNFESEKGKIIFVFNLKGDPILIPDLLEEGSTVLYLF